MNAVATIPTTNVETYRASTNAAALCKEIVLATVMEIQRRRYVKVEGWQAIAGAHGCCCSARDVERIEGGVRAIGEVRRMSDGVVIAEAEGFVGEDEPTWYGGEVENQWGKKTLPKRADYAIRAMAQTRAISRACRSAFAHVVVMMNAGLQTTPAEEVPAGGFDNEVVDHPAPADRRVVNPATGRKVDPLSANQAKKDGRAERAVALDHEVTDLQGVAEAMAWKAAHEEEVATWPKHWREQLWENFEQHVEDLRALAAKLAGADEETGELADEPFPGDLPAPR